MKVPSIEAAWKAADEIFPTDYCKDEAASQRAGYDIYRSTADGHGGHISDLGTRLEVNLPDGSTVNIWIEAEQPVKHFEIGYGIGFHTFTWACSTAYEALEALADIFSHDPKAKRMEMDDYMELLLEIKSGKKLSYNAKPVLIHYLPGEV